MKENGSDGDVVGNHDDGGVVLPRQKAERMSSCSSYTIEVCQGPDCTGSGGGISVLEIEELVREHEYQNHQNGSPYGNRIRVVAGGCRDFCSVGPNAHVLLRSQKQKRGRSSKSMLESFQNVSGASSCDNVVNHAIAYASNESPTDSVDPGSAVENAHTPSAALSVSSVSSTVNRHQSMMERRTERTRWEALKDVSRTIAKSKKVVSTSGSSNGIERKLRIWKETCRDRISRATSSTRPSQRDQRRTERLIEIASKKLDRICLQHGDDSNSSSCSSDQSDTSDEWKL